MDIVATAKEIAEAVTSISAALILLANVFKHSPKPIKRFFAETLPTFLCGFTNANGKKFRFFNAIKEKKEQQVQFKNIVQILAANYESEEIFVLNQKEFLDFLTTSKIFTKISRRKPQ